MVKLKIKDRKLFKHFKCMHITLYFSYLLMFPCIGLMPIKRLLFHSCIRLIGIFPIAIIYAGGLNLLLNLVSLFREWVSCLPRLTEPYYTWPLLTTIKHTYSIYSASLIATTEHIQECSRLYVGSKLPLERVNQGTDDFWLSMWHGF